MEAQQMLQAATAPLLGVLGLALQWIRAFSWFRDWHYGIAAAFFATLAYFLTADFTKYLHGPFGLQLTIVLALLGIAGNVSALMGGTFVASNRAKAAVANGADPTSTLVPLTNSK